MTYTLIYNGTLIDGTGGMPIPNAVILIKDNQIIDIGTEDSIYLPEKEVKRIDANDMFILPGFIDTHVHIMANGFKLEDTMYNLSLFTFIEQQRI